MKKILWSFGKEQVECGTCLKRKRKKAFEKYNAIEEEKMKRLCTHS